MQSPCKFLVRLGVEEETLHVVTFAEEKPLEDAEVSEKNRRVEFRLMEGDIELVLE